MFLNGTESSEWMLSSQLRGWLKHSLPPKTRRMYLALCIQICSQVQNFEKLVQESWLALAILAKTLQKHYVNIFTPVGGEDAAVVAWPEAAARQLLTVISSLETFILHLHERQLTTFHQGIKSCGLLSSHCWETVHRAISMERWMCHQLCLYVVFVAAVGVKLCMLFDLIEKSKATLGF